MRKIGFLLIFVMVLFLSGCEFLSGIKDKLLELETVDNLRVSIYDYHNYDWTTVIKLNTLITEIDPTDLIFTPQEDVYVGEVAKISVSYKKIFTIYEGEFFVKITDGYRMIKELKDLEYSSTVILRGTISEVNETGFILTDDTGYIFIEKSRANKYYTENSTVSIKGIYSNNSFLIEEINTSSEQLELYASTTIDSNEFSSYFKEGFDTTYITTEGVMENQNDLLYLLLDDGSKILINQANTYEFNSLVPYIGQRIIITGWVYNYNADTNSFQYIHDFMNYEYINEKEGSSPVIDASSSYFYFTTLISLNDLKEYFFVEDKEDGVIEVTDSMFNGYINTGQNIITLEVTDSDLNTSTYSFIVEVDKKIDKIDQEISAVNPHSMPSQGTVNVLVIPIGFDEYEKTDSMLNDIKTAFFGTAGQTGWESLTSFYKKSSYNKLNIQGTVTPWYEPKYSPSYYSNYKDEDNYYLGSTILLEEALTYFRNTYYYGNYDSDKDGYIDAVYLIYNNPIGGANHFIQDEFYWAYTSWDYNADNRDYSSIKGFSYVFMGYDFFKENISHKNRYLGLNCETLIHETGHLLNLIDYYDYEEADFINYGGYGGCDMMDHNIGDHGPLSKILLNWVEPVIVNRSGIYKIPSFTKSGVSLLVAANGVFTTIYDEYYLIDYFTFDGLNALHMPALFNSKTKDIGVRVSHVNASLQYSDEYYPYFKYDNTSTKNKFVTLLEADYDGSFDIVSSYSTLAQYSDFYTIGKTFGNSYYNEYTSHKDNEIPFTMTVLETGDGFATVEIKFK